MKLHPLCEMFPRLTGEAYEALKADIAENGQRVPVVTLGDMVLDGGNRYRAAAELGLEVICEPYEGATDPASLIRFVRSMNQNRRHLTAGQYAVVAALAQNWADAQPVGRPENNAATVAAFTTVADRAAASGAGQRTQRKADKVAKANPRLAKKVAQGEVSLDKALERITGTKRKPPTQKAERPEDRPADAADVTDSDADVDPMKEWAAAEERCRALQERVDAFTATDHGAELEKQMRLREIAVRNAEATQNANVQMQRQITKMEGELHRLTGKKRWTDAVAFLKTIVEARAAA